MRWQDTLVELLEEDSFSDRWREQGREQEKEKTVQNMLKMSMPIEDIVQVTELPIEKIRALAAAAT